MPITNGCTGFPAAPQRPDQDGSRREAIGVEVAENDHRTGAVKACNGIHHRAPRCCADIISSEKSSDHAGNNDGPTCKLHHIGDEVALVSAQPSLISAVPAEAGSGPTAMKWE